MDCGGRKARFLSEIGSVRELREARRELELREFFARERLIDDAAGAFTFDNLLAIVAPPGSVVDRVIGGAGTVVATVQGVMGALGAFVGGHGAARRESSARRTTSGRGNSVRRRAPATKAVEKPTAHEKQAAKPAARRKKS